MTEKQYHTGALDNRIIKVDVDVDVDILEHYRYTAFGEVQIYNASGNQVAQTQIDNHILWNTRRRDEITGFYMYKFRHYSAELGRWLARDPIEECDCECHYWDHEWEDSVVIDMSDFENRHHNSVTHGFSHLNPISHEVVFDEIKNELHDLRQKAIRKCKTICDCYETE